MWASGQWRARFLDDGVDQALGTADVQMLAWTGGVQQRLQIEAAGGIIVGVQHQRVAGQRLQFRQEGQLVAAAAAVVQFKGAVGGLERRRHRRHRRDADAASDQHHRLVAGGGFVQREIVLRSFDAEGVAHCQAMHVARAARAGFFQTHAQAVFDGFGEAAGFRRQLHQRVAARLAQARHADLQVGAGAEGGQGAAVFARQAQRADQRRFLPDFTDDEFQGLHGVRLYLDVRRPVSRPVGVPWGRISRRPARPGVGRAARPPRRADPPAWRRPRSAGGTCRRRARGCRCSP